MMRLLSSVSDVAAAQRHATLQILQNSPRSSLDNQFHVGDRQHVTFCIDGSLS